MLQYRIEGLDKLQEKLKDPEIIKGPVHRLLERVAFLIEGKAKEKAPVDTGRLRASIASRIKETEARVGSPVQYAVFVELGTRPHFPPPRALQPWAQRHGLPPGLQGAYMLAHAIAKRGTKAHPFLQPALQESIPVIERFAEEAAREIEAKWGK